MKSFIFKLLGFLVGFICLNIGYLFLIQKVDWNYKKRIEALNLDTPQYDVIVIGNSLAMDGIDTGLLSENGYSSYNLAMAGASLKTNYIQLHEYLTMYDYKPKYVVLGLGAYMNSFSGDEVHPVVDYTMNDRKISYSDIPMIKFKWIFKELIKKMVSKVHRDAYLNYGQLKFAKKIPDKTTINPDREFPLEKYQSSSLIKSIINTCTERGIKILVVELPGYKEVRHKRSFDCLMLDPDHQNGILLDYNSIKGCEVYDADIDWVGNHHLNINGAIKCTKQLLEDLNSINRHDSLNSFCR